MNLVSERKTFKEKLLKMETSELLDIFVVVASQFHNSTVVVFIEIQAAEKEWEL